MSVLAGLGKGDWEEARGCSVCGEGSFCTVTPKKGSPCTPPSTAVRVAYKAFKKPLKDTLADGPDTRVLVGAGAWRTGRTDPEMVIIESELQMVAWEFRKA